MLYAVGLTEEDMHKAQIGIASLWWEGSHHLRHNRIAVYHS